jgi:hypothetical protein
MKHLKYYNEIGKNERVDEGLKEIIVAGALALMSSQVGKSQQKNLMLKDKEKIEVKNKTTQDTLLVDFDNEFESGAHHFSDEKKRQTEEKLALIGDFIKTHKNNHINIRIEASESRVPNIDVETGTRLPIRGLAIMRATETQELIESFLKDMEEKGLFEGTYDTATQVGTTRYLKGEDPKQQKFKSEQWVRVKLSVGERKKTKEDEYKAFAVFHERIYLRTNPYGGARAIADVFIPARKTEDIKQQGNLPLGYQDVLLKTMNNEYVQMETGQLYDGNLYLVPWEWWNGAAAPDGTKRQTLTKVITQEDLDFIKKNYKVK